MSTPLLSFAPCDAGLSVTLTIDGQERGRTVVTRSEVDAMRKPPLSPTGPRDFSGVDTAIAIRAQLWDRGHAHKVLPLAGLRATIIFAWDTAGAARG